MSNIETAIRDTIFNTVLAAFSELKPGGARARAPYQKQEIIVERVWPGQIIEEQEYGDAWSPTNPNGRQAATENLSILANPIPNIGDWYSKSARQVEEMYKYLLNNAVVDYQTNLLSSAAVGHPADPTKETAPPSVLSELSERTPVEVPTPSGPPIKILAMTKSAIEKNKLEIEHSNAAAAAIANRLAGMIAGSRSAVRLIAWRKQSLATALKTTRAWEALQKAAPSSLPKPPGTKVTAGSVAKAFYDAKQAFTRSTLASVLNPGIQYHPSYTSPENWVNPEASQGWPMMTIPVAGDPLVDLTLSFSRVDLSRPWLLASLFQLNGWKILQDPPGYLSSGTRDNNSGMFALLPNSVIVARDIVAKDNKRTVFCSKALQILAWVNKINPYSPPNPKG